MPSNYDRTFFPVLGASLHAVWRQASCQVPISLSFGQWMWMFYVSCIERYSRLEEEKHCEICIASNCQSPLLAPSPPKWMEVAYCFGTWEIQHRKCRQSFRNFGHLSWRKSHLYSCLKNVCFIQICPCFPWPPPPLPTLKFTLQEGFLSKL